MTMPIPTDSTLMLLDRAAATWHAQSRDGVLAWGRLSAVWQLIGLEGALDAFDETMLLLTEAGLAPAGADRDWFLAGLAILQRRDCRGLAFLRARLGPRAELVAPAMLNLARNLAAAGRVLPRPLVAGVMAGNPPRAA